ncbi:MAG: response regulator receiver protein [Myxococcaceae bacterium]|nr:response regulator receiver protein [Myxococcaceae bacterium]
MSSSSTHGPILVVEDDPDIREGTTEFLTDNGFEVFAAENGLEALRLLREHPNVRLILLDLMMPIMDGWTFRRKQLADAQLASIPVFILSAASRTAKAAAADDLQALKYLPKPFSWPDLLGMMDSYR